MTRFMIFPYTQGSAGAKAIAEELDGKRILRQNSTYKPKEGDVIINWGASDCPFPQALNYSTKGITNKIEFFDLLKGAGLTPRYTTSKQTAADFMQFPVFCRTRVEGKDGEGIVVAKNPDELVDAKLYVEGVDKWREFRVHVGRGPDGKDVLIGVQQKWVPDKDKLVDPDVWAGEGTNFVWTVNGVEVELDSVSVARVFEVFDKYPGLTFGAFDVVVDNSGMAYVLEINSAPTITPKTAEKYGAFFRKWEVAEEAPVISTPAWAPSTPSTSIISGSATNSLLVEASDGLVLATVKSLLAHIPGVKVS